MPRTSAKTLENYTHVGDYTWKEAVANGKGLGVFGILPCDEMLSPDGYQRDISNSQTQTYITVTFDKDYVHEYIHKKIVLGLGFMRGDNFHQEGFKRFMEEQITYSLEENKRTNESEMIKIATELSSKYGQSFDFWFNTLKEKASQTNEAPEPQKELVGASNGRAKTKV